MTTMNAKSHISAWKRFKAPALFGIGLYVGLNIFGEHRENKEKSQYLEELKARFQQDRR